MAKGSGGTRGAKTSSSRNKLSSTISKRTRMMAGDTEVDVSYFKIKEYSYGYGSTTFTIASNYSANMESAFYRAERAPLYLDAKSTTFQRELPHPKFLEIFGGGRESSRKREFESNTADFKDLYVALERRWNRHYNKLKEFDKISGKL